MKNISNKNIQFVPEHRIGDDWVFMTLKLLWQLAIFTVIVASIMFSIIFAMVLIFIVFLVLCGGSKKTRKIKF